MERQGARMDYVPTEKVFFERVTGNVWSAKLNRLKRRDTYTEPI